MQLCALGNQLNIKQDPGLRREIVYIEQRQLSWMCMHSGRIVYHQSVCNIVAHDILTQMVGTADHR